MESSFQILFNAAFSIVSIGLGWFLKSIGDELKQLRLQDDTIRLHLEAKLDENATKADDVARELLDKVNRVELLVAGQYVRKDDYQVNTNRIIEKLEVIQANQTDILQSVSSNFVLRKDFERFETAIVARLDAVVTPKGARSGTR